MKKIMSVMAFIGLSSGGLNAFRSVQVPMKLDAVSDTKISVANHVDKKLLSNGLTVLVREVHTLPKVSVQLWVNVGSKDENNAQKGMAHWLEHMIFKGTDDSYYKNTPTALPLSESDINTITHMLSGYTNAFTSYDYTGYLFNMPKQHWHEVFPILADCMVNVALKQEHLNSEMKAVIQELKMNRDSYKRAIMLEMLGDVFSDHPYHYPVIGYKQHLWNLNSSDLREFYKQHYLPNNAALVVVGDVKASEVFELAQKYFGHLKPNPNYKKEQHFFNEDIIAKSVTLYRDVQQPYVMCGFVVPGSNSYTDQLFDALNWVLGASKSSRLYHRLVDQEHLATSVDVGGILLFEHGMYVISFEPVNMAALPRIKEIINEEIDDIITNGFKPGEITKAVKQSRMQYYRMLEDIQGQAYEIGKYFLAIGDENYVFNYLLEPEKEIENQLIELLKRYFRPSVMNTGFVLPIAQQEKPFWLELQQNSDQEDKRILHARERHSPIEAPIYASQVKVMAPGKFDFPKPATVSLPNGMKVLYAVNRNTPKVNVTIELKTRPYYDSDEQPGLYNFVMAMLSEGTKKYTAAQLAQELDSRGMSFDAYPGGMSMVMLKDDVPFAFELLTEIVTHPTFPDSQMEKVRLQLSAAIKNFWDSPKSFSKQLLDEHIYKGHPFSKNILGTAQSIASITRKDVVDFYKRMVTPHEAKIAIVGDIDEKRLLPLLEKTIGTWHGPRVPTVEFPSLTPASRCELQHQINRDQVVLCIAGLSIDRRNPDYDKMLIFDQIFGGGALGSMHSRLFQLREQSGLFYWISGSLVVGAGEQPGMVLVKTIVSLDRLEEAETAIRKTIDEVVENLKPSEFIEAKNAIINSIMNNFESNGSIAQAFLFVDRYGFGRDFFDTRAQQLEAITLPQLQTAVKRVLNNEQLITLRVGRVEKNAAPVVKNDQPAPAAP